MATQSAKSKRRALKSDATSGGDRRAGSVGERPELARSGGKDSSDATGVRPHKRSGSTEPAEA